jgi:hypothetical protein
MYEVWVTLGRTRRVVARFRMLTDANKYVVAYEGDGALEVRGPSRARRRTKSQAGAKEHPDEFIADRTCQSGR